MHNAAVLPTREMTQWKMHQIAKEAVDEVAPRHLNKKSRLDWVARELGVGFDRVRKAYGNRVKCVEHHEIMTWEERYVRLLLKWEGSLAARHERYREKIRLWQERHSQNAAADPARDVDASRCVGGG
jgi:hypothetical protein